MHIHFRQKDFSADVKKTINTKYNKPLLMLLLNFYAQQDKILAANLYVSFSYFLKRDSFSFTF